MKYKIITLLISTIVLQVNAADVHSITEISYEKSETSFDYDIHTSYVDRKIFDAGDIESTIGKFESSYYFSGRQIVGPWDQFKYIDPSSYISISHSVIEKDFKNLASDLIYYYGSKYWEKQDYNSSNISGRYYFRKLFAGGGLIHSSFDDSTLGNLELGMLFFEKLELGAIGNETEGNEYDFSASLRYEHKINEKSFIGVSALISENSESSYLALKYFLAIQDHYYLSNEILLSEKSWKVKSSFYFNKRLSMSLGYANDNNLSMIGARYFITNNFSLSIQHSSDFEDYYTSKASISAQF